MAKHDIQLGSLQVSFRTKHGNQVIYKLTPKGNVIGLRPGFSRSKPQNLIE